MLTTSSSGDTARRDRIEPDITSAFSRPTGETGIPGPDARQGREGAVRINAPAQSGRVTLYAVSHHGFPRVTGDIDVWVRPTPENADRVVRALVAFGFGVQALTPELFVAPDSLVRMGLPPNRIEVRVSQRTTVGADPGRADLGEPLSRAMGRVRLRTT